MALLEVGRVAKPHGVRGEVVVELVTDRVERLAAGTVLVSEDGPLEVVRASRHGGPARASGRLTAGPGQRWIVAFAGVTRREQAEALRGTVLSAAPLDDPDALWVHELVGAEVLDREGRRLGTVSAVEANPASDLLVLEDGGLVPLRFVVDRGPGRLVVDAPPGLLD